jgi:predicted Zn-dependent protease with MMP-like domain
VGEGRFPRHVARPQCRQLCKFRDRRHKAPKKKPSLSQHRFWHHCGDGCAFGPGLNDPFEEAIDDALSSLPADLRAAMSNVEIVVEDEPPDGQPLLGLYRGVPLPRRSSTYSGVLPDKISIFGGPITRLAAGDADRLRREVRHVVLHEIAHHFGISDERLIELDRY